MTRKENSKTYTLQVSRMHFGNRPADYSEVSGTLEYLTDYFSYTLLVGNSYDRRINMYPKTIKSLVSNLNKAYMVKNNGMTGVELL